MNKRAVSANGLVFALAIALVGGCGKEPGVAEVPPVEATSPPQAEPAPARPLTVFDTGGPLAITPVMEAWRAEGGGRFAVAESDYSTPYPEETDVLIAGSMASLWAFAEEDKLRPLYSADIEGRVDEAGVHNEKGVSTTRECSRGGGTPVRGVPAEKTCPPRNFTPKRVLYWFGAVEMVPYWCKARANKQLLC